MKYLQLLTNKLLDTPRFVGLNILIILSSLGDKILFLKRAIFYLFVKPFYYKIFFKQLIEIAFFSLPIVGLTAFFTGMVLALQSYTGFSRFDAEGAVANIVILSMTRELGPVLTGLMVAGRVSGAMAAEIGTMRVTDQIDALYTMNINPMQYIIAPRVLAGILAMPFLTLIADILGVFGGLFISVVSLDFNSFTYITASWDFVTAFDIISGLIKGAVFGLLISTTGCFYGYRSKNGALGVGKSTTNAVVISSISIFIADYALTLVFF